MKYSFDADGPTEKKIQYYEMFGTRALWHDGWHVVAQRAPQQGATAADFVNETWELYHSEEDRAERHDLAAEHPEKVKELVNLWYVEAGKYDVLPLDNRSMEDLIKLMPVADIPEGGIYRYYPQTLAGAGVRRGGDPGPVVQDPRRRRAHRRLRGRAHRQRSPVRRPHALHQGAQALVRQQLPRASRPSRC